MQNHILSRTDPSVNDSEVEYPDVNQQEDAATQCVLASNPNAAELPRPGRSLLPCETEQSRDILTQNVNSSNSDQLIDNREILNPNVSEPHDINTHKSYDPDELNNNVHVGYADGNEAKNTETLLQNILLKENQKPYPIDKISDENKTIKNVNPAEKTNEPIENHPTTATMNYDNEIPIHKPLETNRVDKNPAPAPVRRLRSATRRAAENKSFPFEVPVLSTVGNTITPICEAIPQKAEVPSENNEPKSAPKRRQPLNPRPNSPIKDTEVVDDGNKRNALPECNPPKKKRGRPPKSQQLNDSTEERMAQAETKSNILMNLFIGDHIEKDPDQRAITTNTNTNSESNRILPNDATIEPVKEKQSKQDDLCENDKSSELYKILTETQTQKHKPSNETQNPAKLSEHASLALLKINRKWRHVIMKHDQRHKKQELEDIHFSRHNESFNQRKTRHETEEEDYKNLNVLPVKQEYGTQHFTNQESHYEFPIIPFEYDQKPETTFTLKAEPKPIKQEISGSLYQEVPMQYPVKNEPYWRELDMTGGNPNYHIQASKLSSAQHPIKEELNQLTRCHATNNLPAMLQQQTDIRVKQESEYKAYQQPKEEPYWSQLDVRGINTQDQMPRKTQAIKAESSRINPNQYSRNKNYLSETTNLLQQKAIKQELIHDYHDPAERLQHANLPSWHPSDISHVKEELPTNVELPKIRIKQELQYLNLRPTVSFDQHQQTFKSWHQPVDRYHEIDIQRIPISVKREIVQTQNRTSETPVLPVKEEPSWPELDVTIGYNVKQELIRQHNTTAGTVKKEPTLQQQYPLNQIKREENRQHYLAAKGIGTSIQNERYTIPPSQLLPAPSNQPRGFHQQCSPALPYTLSGIPPTSHLDPRLHHQHLVAPEYEQGMSMQSRKRSRKDSAQKHEATGFPAMFPAPPAAQDALWQHQEELASRHLSQPQYHTQNAETADVRFQDSNRRFPHHLPTPLHIQSIEQQHRNAKRHYQEQVFHNTGMVPPHMQRSLIANDTEYRQWQHAPTSLAPGNTRTVPNPLHLHQQMLLAQQRQMTAFQQQASKRSKQKHQPFNGISGTYHSQEISPSPLTLTHSAGQGDATGHILRAALAVSNTYNTPYP